MKFYTETAKHSNPSFGGDRMNLPQISNFHKMITFNEKKQSLKEKAQTQPRMSQSLELNDDFQRTQEMEHYSILPTFPAAFNELRRNSSSNQHSSN